MRTKALALLLSLLPAAALAQSAPANLPAQTVFGRLGIPGDTGPGQAIPFSVLVAQLLGGAQTANTVYAGPASGSAASPAFRLLVGADLPAPGASSFGGVQSKTCSTSNWFSSLSTGGVFGCSQPAFSDITGTIAASQLPNPTASTLGGVKSLVAVAHNYLTSISTAGLPVAAQPVCADLSDSTTYCNSARGQLLGTATNDNATAGNIGEYVESVINSGSAVSLTSTQAKTVTSISLTAGDWDVDAIAAFIPAGSTSITYLNASIGTSTNTQDATPGRFYTLGPGTAYVPGVNAQTAIVPSYRFSLSGTTTIFLVEQAIFTVSTLGGYGILRARRIR